MIEDDKVQHGEQPPEQYGESLIYDFAKFLTTLSILALGGVLTIAETADTADVKTFNIVMVSLALAAAAAVAAITASVIAIARFTGEALPPRLERWISAAVALLGMGLGMFIYMWIDKLN